MLTDNAWRHNKFAARPLSRPWHGKLQPLLAINPSRLFVAAGHTVYTYLFVPSPVAGAAPRVVFECSYTLSSGPHGPRRDITAVAVAPDGGLDRTLFVGFEHGALDRVTLPPVQIGSRDVHVDASCRTGHGYHDGELVESLSVSGDLLLSLSSSGTAGLLNSSFSSPSPEPDLLDLGSRGWSSYLSPASGGSPYAAFGLSSTTPLLVHPVLSSSISAAPSAVLCSAEKDRDPSGERRPSAVYGICGTPPAFPWGASDRILVSGWYDGFVHVHDMRSDRRASSSSSSSTSTSSTRAQSDVRTHTTPAPLRPTLSLSDPWSFEPIYALSTGGGASSQIAAGSARHSVIAFWDVRYFKAGTRPTTTILPSTTPTTTTTAASTGGAGKVGKHASGWSVHAPGNDPSPVYSLIMESSRVFGATQSRPFVFDFGPGVGRGTYPALEREEGLGGGGGRAGGWVCVESNGAAFGRGGKEGDGDGDGDGERGGVLCDEV